MPKGAKIDFSRPYYINSYNADEAIFHMIRGTRLKAGNYDASLPVSLESLKIKEICAKREICKEFPSVFRVDRKSGNSKMYTDAVINIKFSNQGEFTKWKRGTQNSGVLSMDQIRRDYESFCCGKIETDCFEHDRV